MSSFWGWASTRVGGTLGAGWLSGIEAVGGLVGRGWELVTTWALIASLITLLGGEGERGLITFSSSCSFSSCWSFVIIICYLLIAPVGICSICGMLESFL